MRSRFALALFLSFLPAASPAQDWSWPERAENLQQLPADFPGERLRAVMTGFSRALGVRCNHCHVGEDGAPLSTFDFVSDDKREKRVAREMLAMLGDINRSLASMERRDPPANMWCHTCHAGRPVPRRLGEELGLVLQEAGPGAVVERYRALRERHYGLGGYSFQEGVLNALGYEALETDVAGAIAIFRLNAEMYPESGNVYDSLGEAYEAAGERESAIQAYEASLARDPGNANARARLDALR